MTDAMHREDLSLDAEIVEYWNERSTSYSNGVIGELHDERRTIWWNAIIKRAGGVLDEVRREGRAVRVLDLGCGPGFFTALFSEAGCQVDAVDSSAEMIARARANVKAAVPDAEPMFCECDFTELPFADGTFDLAVGRNVTWLMRRPEAAYAEWLRVLRPGGKLLLFDANWYRYLIDPATAAARETDMANNALVNWDEDSRATTAEEKHCEQMALELPLTYILRPAWDATILSSMGVEQVHTDKLIWREVWTESEHSCYGATPMFLVEAVK